MKSELEADLRLRFGDMVPASVPLDLGDEWHPVLESHLNAIRWAARGHAVRVVEVKVTSHWPSNNLLTIHVRPSATAPKAIQDAVQRAARKARWSPHRLPDKVHVARDVQAYVTAAIAAGRPPDIWALTPAARSAVIDLTPDTAADYDLSPSDVSHYLNLRKSSE